MDALILLTLVEPWLATQTSSPESAMPLGPDPTRTGLEISSPVLGSILETVPSRPLATHTEPASTAIPSGPSPTPTARVYHRCSHRCPGANMFVTILFVTIMFAIVETWTPSKIGLG